MKALETLSVGDRLSETGQLPCISQRCWKPAQQRRNALTRMQATWTLSLALLAMGTGACGAARANKSSSVDAGAGVGKASKRIGPEGGSLTLKGGVAKGTTIVIPTGALTSEVEITMETKGEVSNLPPDVKSAGPIVDFGPDGQQFAKPVSILLPVAENSHANAVYTESKGTGPWVPVPDAKYDPERGVMVANVMHFTMYINTQEFVDKGGIRQAPTCVKGDGINQNGNLRLGTECGAPEIGYLLRSLPGDIVKEGTDSKTIPNYKFVCIPACTAMLITDVPNPTADTTSDLVVTTSTCVLGADKGAFDTKLKPENYPKFAIGFGNVCEGNHAPVTFDKNNVVGPGSVSSESYANLECPGSPVMINEGRYYDSIYRVRSGVALASALNISSEESGGKTWIPQPDDLAVLQLEEPVKGVKPATIIPAGTPFPTCAWSIAYDHQSSRNGGRVCNFKKDSRGLFHTQADEVMAKVACAPDSTAFPRGGFGAPLLITGGESNQLAGLFLGFMTPDPDSNGSAQTMDSCGDILQAVTNKGSPPSEAIFVDIASQYQPLISTMKAIRDANIAKPCQ